MAAMRGSKGNQMVAKRRKPALSRSASMAPATMMATKAPSAPMMAPPPSDMSEMAPGMKKGGRVKAGGRKKGGLMVMIAIGKKKKGK